MNKTLLILFALFFGSFTEQVTAQTNNETKSDTIAANPADVASIESVVKATYDVISGGIGQKRDWNRFRTLFYKDARMIPTGKSRKTGITGAYLSSIEEYITLSSPFMEKEGFFEKEVANRVEVYGTMAHVFSTYESFYKLDDKTPFERGINSFQLVNDGKRWWIIDIMWLGETPEVPIPGKYLKNK